MKRIFAGTTCLAAVLLGAAFAEQNPKTPPANSGREMYRAYCASCHGLTGKGDGPVAKALKAAPHDLTTLSRRNQGRFPAVRVYQTIEGSASVAAHGSRDMPVWGDFFRLRGGTDEAQVKLRIRNLTTFIESLQVK